MNPLFLQQLTVAYSDCICGDHLYCCMQKAIWLVKMRMRIHPTCCQVKLCHGLVLMYMMCFFFLPAYLYHHRKFFGYRPLPEKLHTLKKPCLESPGWLNEQLTSVWQFILLLLLTKHFTNFLSNCLSCGRTLIIRTAFLMSRTPSYTKRDASMNSFSSKGCGGFVLSASIATSTCSAKRGMTAERNREIERAREGEQVYHISHLHELNKCKCHDKSTNVHLLLSYSRTWSPRFSSIFSWKIRLIQLRTSGYTNMST